MHPRSTPNKKTILVYITVVLVFIIVFLTFLIAYQHKELNKRNILLSRKYTSMYTTTVLYLMSNEETITDFFEKREITLSDISELKYQAWYASTKINEIVLDYKSITNSNYLDGYDQSFERYLLSLYKDYLNIEKQFIQANKSTIDLDQNTSAILQVHLEEMSSIVNIIKDYYPSIDTSAFSTEEILTPEKFLEDDKWQKVLLDLNDMTKER